MGHQENVFLKTEGDAWHRRNLDKERKPVVLEACREAGLSPKSAMEFGCGAGFNIAGICAEYGCIGMGMDPSSEAISMAKKLHPNISFMTATAYYRYFDKQYDLLIYGFCLYLCDRGSLSTVVSTGDLALSDGGHIVIHDFDPDYPHKVPYHHFPGLFSYKQNYARLWLANPAYTLVRKNVFDDGTAVWVLKKDVAAGWPLQVTP